MHYQFFALDADNNIHSVDEVANGVACGCHCSECGGGLEAKQGPIRRWHFAHVKDTGCSGGAETALHLAAKRMLLQSPSLLVPHIAIVRTVTLDDGRHGRGVAVRPAGYLAYLGAQEEVRMGDIQPDVVLETDFGPVIVEVTVTHGVDREKHGKLIKLSMPALEITLQLARSLKRDQDKHTDAWAELHLALIEGVKGKTWLVDVEKARLSDEAMEAAEQNAKAINFEPMAASPQSFPGNVTVSVGRDRVTVRTLPFGLAVKAEAVGDVAIDPKLISLIKYLGGKWNKRYKNWICPLDNQQGVHLGLRKLASQIHNEPHGERHKRVLAAYATQQEPRTVMSVESQVESKFEVEPDDELGSARGINERIRARIAAEKAKCDG